MIAQKSCFVEEKNERGGVGCYMAMVERVEESGK